MANDHYESTRYHAGLSSYDGHKCAPYMIVGPDKVKFWVSGAQRGPALEALDNAYAAGIAEGKRLSKPDVPKLSAYLAAGYLKEAE